MDHIRTQSGREASASVLNRLLDMAEQQSGRRAISSGPTGRTVAKNLERLRRVRGLTTRQLSAELEEAGRPIPASGITRMEKGDRQVSVDDLTALAAVLRVSPSALLLPLDDAPTSTLDVTGAGAIGADVAWDWMDGRRPLRFPEGEESTGVLDHELYARPPGRRQTRKVRFGGRHGSAELNAWAEEDQRKGSTDG